MQPIVITGFHHSGTSILRKVIGNHPDVYDVTDEVGEGRMTRYYPIVWRIHLTATSNHKFMVIKSPNLSNRLFRSLKSKKRARVVAILRDPRDVLASLKLRYGGQYSIGKFTNEFLSCAENSLQLATYQHGYLVRYEDMFTDDFAGLKRLFDWLGLDFVNDVIDKNTDRQVPMNFGHVPMLPPSRLEQSAFRSYQINQPVVQMSGRFAEILTPQELRAFDTGRLAAMMTRLGYGGDAAQQVQHNARLGGWR